MKKILLAFVIVALTTTMATAGPTITDDFSGGPYGGYDLYWNWIPQGGNQSYSASISTGQLSITADTLGGGAQSVGAIPINLGAGPAPYAYNNVFVSMDMNLDPNKNDNDQGLVTRLQVATTQFYGLNYDPYLKGIGLIYFDGTDYVDLAPASIGDTEQAVTLKLQAINVGSNVLLVGQAWSIDAQPSLLGEVQFLVGVDTPQDESEVPILGAGAVGFYTNFNTNGSPANIDSLLDNFRARDGLQGDTNFNGSVNIDDLGNLLANYGTSTGMLWSNGDTNGDDAVNIDDLGNLLANYGTGVSVQAGVSEGGVVPEPSTIGLILAGLAASALYWVRKRR